jgi:signal transduction histidine kinase
MMTFRYLNKVKKRMFFRTDRSGDAEPDGCGKRGEEMKNKTLLAGLLSALLAVMLILLSAGPVFAAEGDTRVIRAAVYNNSNLAYQDKDGIWHGSDVECLINIAQRAGFRIEFIDSANDPDFLSNLDNGTYDIVCDVVKTPEREEKYQFSETALGTMNNILTVRADDDRWEFGNIEQISSMKVGILRTYANNEEFRNWCSLRGVTPEIVEYDDYEEMTAELKNGNIDCILYSLMYGTDYTKNFRTVLQLLPETYYFTFRKDDTALKNAVDEKLSQIIMENPDYLMNLNNRYMKQFAQNDLPLSEIEKEYIAQHKTISVAVLENDEPYFYQDSDGTAHGVIPDYYALISDYAGLNFSFVTYPTKAAAINSVTTGETDILGLFSGGIIAADQNGLMLTGSITTVNNVLLTKSGVSITDVMSASAIEQSAATLGNLESDILSEVKFSICETPQECFQMLKNGTTDATVVGMPSATWLLNQTNSSLYSVTSLPGMSLELCSAVRVDNNTLRSILDKSITATRENVDGIIARDTLPESDWKTYLNRIPSYTVVLIAGALLVLVIGLTWALILLRKRQKERTAVLAAQAETERQKLRIETIQKNTEEQGHFFSNISHDMRTPLNAVLGFIRLAQKNDVTSDQRREYLKKAESSGALMLDLINDTLTMSKATSGKLELHLEPVSTEELCESVTTPIRVLAAQKNISFVADKSGCRPRTILADRLALQKVFLNIMNNAIKYTPSGGHVWVTAYDEPKDAEDPDIVCVIKDDGIGISPEFIPHVFEPFQQEKRQGYESVGTGLGLSIVKQLIDCMGGTVDVISEKDKGTTFTVRLHFEDAEETEIHPITEKENLSVNFTGKKVLLCEDNILNREIAVAMLKEKNIDVDTAENGEIGVHMFSESKEGTYDTILMDIRMPVMDGLEATRAIRSLNRPDAKEVPIIAMTADAYDDDIYNCILAGMDGHIAKPIDPEAFFRTLAAAMCSTY